MNVITLREYAKQNKISYEAVRKQIVRYKDELEGHIIKDGRQQFLDEEAVAFLNDKRQKNPIVIIQQDKDEQIEALNAQITMLQAKVTEQAEKLSAQSEELRAMDKLLVENEKLLLASKEDKEKVEALEAQNADLSAEREELIEKNLEAEKKAQEASEKLETEQTRKISLKEWFKRRK